MEWKDDGKTPGLNVLRVVQVNSSTVPLQQPSCKSQSIMCALTRSFWRRRPIKLLFIAAN